MKKIIAITIPCLMLSGCAQMDKHTEFALTGCGAGAVLGAGIGYLLSGPRGAIAGGVAGCMAGGAVGYQVAEHTVNYQNAQDAYNGELKYVTSETEKLKKYNSTLQEQILAIDNEVTGIQQGKLSAAAKQVELNKLKSRLAESKKEIETQVAKLDQEIGKSESALEEYKSVTVPAELAKWKASVEEMKTQRDIVKNHVVVMNNINDRIGA